MRPVAPIAFGLLLFASCSTRVPAASPFGNPDTQQILALVRQAMDIDSRGGLAEHLYVQPPLIVVNGSMRTGWPRFAGVGTGGTTRISEVTAGVNTPTAWAHASYRWVSADGTNTEDGRVTFFLENEGGGWRIKHAHSSTVPPWERR